MYRDIKSRAYGSIFLLAEKEGGSAPLDFSVTASGKEKSSMLENRQTENAIAHFLLPNTNPLLGFSLFFSTQNKKYHKNVIFFSGGERGIRTLAALANPTSLAN